MFIDNNYFLNGFLCSLIILMFKMYFYCSSRANEKHEIMKHELYIIVKMKKIICAKKYKET